MYKLKVKCVRKANYSTYYNSVQLLWCSINDSTYQRLAWIDVFCMASTIQHYSTFYIETRYFCVQLVHISV